MAVARPPARSTPRRDRAGAPQPAVPRAARRRGRARCRRAEPSPRGPHGRRRPRDVATSSPSLDHERGVILAGGGGAARRRGRRAVRRGDRLAGARRSDVAACDRSTAPSPRSTPCSATTALAAELRPDVVVRIGRPAASKVLAQWVAASGAPLVQVGGPGVIDPDHGVVARLDAGDAAGARPSCSPGVGDRAWRERWLGAAATGRGGDRRRARPGGAAHRAGRRPHRRPSPPGRRRARRRLVDAGPRPRVVRRADGAGPRQPRRQRHRRRRVDGARRRPRRRGHRRPRRRHRLRPRRRRADRARRRGAPTCASSSSTTTAAGSSRSSRRRRRCRAERFEQLFGTPARHRRRRPRPGPRPRRHDGDHGRRARRPHRRARPVGHPRRHRPGRERRASTPPSTPPSPPPSTDPDPSVSCCGCLRAARHSDGRKHSDGSQGRMRAREHGLELGLGLGELGQRVAVGDDAAAGQQAGPAAVGGQLGAADGDGPRAVAGGVDPADGAAVAARARRPRPRRSAPARRPAGDRRGPVSATAPRTSSSTFGGGDDSSPSIRVPRCCTLATVTIDGSGSQSRKLHHGSSVSWTTSITTRCSTWFFVLAIELRRRSRRPASTSPVRGAVPASGCERTVWPSTSTSSSGEAPIEPVDGVPVARPERRLQPLQHAVAVDRPVGGDGDLPGDHRLRQPAVAHRVAGRAPRRRGSARPASPARSCTPTPTGSAGAAPASGSAAPSIVGHQPSPVGRLAHGHRRHDQLAGRRRVERHPADGDRCRRRRRPSCRRGRSTPAAPAISSAGAAGGDAAAGDPDAVADEQEAVAAGDVVEVERRRGVVGDAGDGAHQRSRVPTSSWVMPPLRSRWVASANPARRSIATISAGGGR